METGSAQARASRNEALFRQVNEQIESLNEGFEEIAGSSGWVCECADPTCIEQFRMTLAQYEALRAHSDRFAIVPDEAHFRPDAEVVIEKRPDYWIVEKKGDAAEIAEELDPRRD